ncbi:MAG: nitrile hydratase accessory protein [Methylobacteriaceae bacterium]|nr:nitrile hydratase accessory protein [Methylobacteriaceae bacterium]
MSTGQATQNALDALDATHPIPRDAGGPVFAEPWQARAFAFTLELHARGVFGWPEWATALAEEIRAAQSRGDPDLGDTYWDHWLATLEALLARKGVTTPGALSDKRDAWARAAAATPHGRPILLDGREG